jgi:hypothetical protein
MLRPRLTLVSSVTQRRAHDQMDQETGGIAAGIAGALASGAVMASGTANADLASNRAQLVCERMNYSPTIAAINGLYRHSGLDRRTFNSSVIYGVRDFCPQHRALADVWLAQGGN